MILLKIVTATLFMWVLYNLLRLRLYGHEFSLTMADSWRSARRLKKREVWQLNICLTLISVACILGIVLTNHHIPMPGWLKYVHESIAGIFTLLFISQGFVTGRKSPRWHTFAGNLCIILYLFLMGSGSYYLFFA